MISGVQTRRELCELLARGFFEGIETIADFVRLRVCHVHFDEGTLEYRGVRRKMSPEFFKAVDAYWKFLDANQKGRATASCPQRDMLGVLARGGGTEADRERYRRNQAKNIKRCMSKISEESGCEITPERLFVSGFLEFVRKKCIEEGRDHVFFVQIFRCAYETKYHKIIEIYAKEYGMPGKIYSEKLRLRCYPYVIRDKRMFEKTVDR